MSSHRDPKIDDPLVQLQLEVARRADELANHGTTRTSLNLHCWLQAEHEVLGASWSNPPLEVGSSEIGEPAWPFSERRSSA